MDTNEEHAQKCAPRPPDVRPKTTAAQDNTVPPGATPSMKEIKAYPIDSNFIDTDLLEAYFENGSKSNGGPVAKVKLHGDYALVQFETEEDAIRVLTRPKHAIGKFEIFVEPYVMTDSSSKNAPSDDTCSRTLVVMGTNNMEKELLEAWFESPKNGGGPVEKINFVEQNGITEVIFETAELVTNFIKQKTAVIRGVTVTFLEPTELDEEEEDDEPSSSIIVLGVGEELDEEVLSLYFASEKRTGGGDIEAIEVDAAQDRAVIRFKDPEVAKRVLEKEELTIMKKQIKISPVIKWKWDGRTLEVHGVPAEYDSETLQLILENEKKGGGPLLDIRMGNACAVATFVNKLDAKRLLDQGEITIGKHIFKFKQPCDPVDEQPTTTGQKAETEASTEITVLGITKGMNEEVLQMFFENEKQSGGGLIEEIKVDEEWGTAVITYQTSPVAERVAGRRKLILRGQELTVNLRANMKKSFHTASHSGQESRDKEQNLLLEVTNVPEGTADQMLELMFESHIYGGGPVKEVIMNAETGTATICFENKESVESVMKTYHGNKSMFKIKAVQLILKVVDEFTTVQVKNSCAIHVKDIPVNCTDEGIKLYFENRRMCGGGSVEEVYNLKDSCVITFMEPEVASRVYQRHCSAPLNMENITLKVKLMTNSHRLKTFGNEAIIQPNTLFVEDLPEDTTRDSLIAYLEKVPDSKISDIWFGIHVGMALVMFSKMPEWLRFFTHCCLKPFRGHMLGISCVEKKRNIEVYNIGNCSKQNLEMYFEHKRSGGGEIEHTDVYTNTNNVIVTFKKYGVADAVVAKKKHTLKNSELLVRLHYPCIGILPVDHDKSTPKSSIPDDIVCHPVDKDIVQFLSQGRSKDFDEQLATVHAKIDWADIGNDLFDSITLKCTLLVAKASKDQTEEWPNKAKEAFWGTYKLYWKETVSVLQDGWSEFSAHISSLVRSSETLAVLTDADSCSVVIVGKSTDVPDMFREISQVKYAVEDAISRKREGITEEVKNLPVFKLRFIQTSRFLQEMKSVYPNAKVDLDMKSGKIIMRGLPDEVQTIKLRILEMLNEIQSETINLRPGVCDLLKQKKTRDHVVNRFKTQQIFMLFEVINRGQVMIGSRKADDLTNGKAILKAAVQEMVINISDENVPTLGTNDWRDFMNQLKAANHGELILEVDSAKGSITIVCVDDISAGVREDIHRFLNENTILEQMIKMDIGAVRYLGEYKKDTLDQISTQFKVDIEILKHSEKHGLMLRGTKQCLQQCIKHVMTLAENIVQCSHGIDKPGMPKYFTSPKGKDYLESLEMRHKVAILIDDEDTAVSSVADLLTTVSPVSFKEPRVKSAYTILNGPNVLVVEGDLTEYKVDVIVNAANEELAHVGGIAKAIVDKDYFQGTSVDEFEVFEPTATKSFAHPRRMNFLIYADSQSTIAEITKRIDATCDSESKEQVFESERDQETIKNLTKEQIEEINNFEITHDVIINVERIGRIQRIVVSGRMEDTLEVVTQINKLFRVIEDAEDLHKRVQWMCDEGAGFEPYPPPISAIIEKAFQKNEPRVEFTEETETNELRTCRINFSENMEVRYGDPKQTYAVKRSCKESYEPPKNWDPMVKDEVYKTVQLSNSSAEYKEVETKFKTSLSSKGVALNSIISITRIQNPSLYQRYCVHLEHMVKCNPPQVKNELELWHGTADAALDEIHANGFNRGFCGLNGTAYGKGVYFAVHASLSAGYAKPNASGQKHMYLCRVLVGEATRGNPAFIVPPAKNPAHPAIKYDSVVDNETNPSMVVIFFDTQAYPEYLIKYT